MLRYFSKCKVGGTTRLAGGLGYCSSQASSEVGMSSVMLGSTFSCAGMSGALVSCNDRIVGDQDSDAGKHKSWNLSLDSEVWLV